MKMNARKLNSRMSQVGNSATTKMTQLCNIADSAGCKSFCAALKAVCFDSGQMRILQELNDAIIGYDVIELSSESDIKACVDGTIQRRSYSAMRFKCILNNLTTSLQAGGRYFKVISKREKRTYDVIFICNQGAIAATSEFYAVHGYPGKHVLAVFAAGHMQFNPIKHLHPNLLQPFAMDLNVDDMHKLTVRSEHAYVDKLIGVSSFVEWDYWVKQTEDAWRVSGLGDGEFDLLLKPTVSLIRNQPDTKEEKHRKICLYFQNAANSNADDSKYIEECYEILKQRRASRGLIMARINSDILLSSEQETIVNVKNAKAVGPKGKKRKPNAGTNI